MNLFVVFSGLQLEEQLLHQMDMDQWPKMKEQLAKTFASRTQAEWCETFKDLDACVEPVLTVDEAVIHPHNKDRGTFVLSEGLYEPTPAPKLSRTPGNCEQTSSIHSGQHTKEILLEAGYSEAEIQELLKEGVVYCPNMKSSL